MQRLDPFRKADACPDREALVAFSLGRLPAASLESVADHISSCDRCEQVLSDIPQDTADDSVVARVKQCFAQGPCPGEPGAVRMEAAARALATSVDESGQTDPHALALREEEPPLPKSIGPYVVLDKIGHGGMGVVYRARQLPIDRPVALKMILAGVHASAQAVVRFDIEGKAVARLQHPHVVQIYEFGEYEGLPYFSMELVEGGSLEAKLAGGPLEPHAAARLVRALATAVEYAHQRQVVHRDLKPANILLDADGTPKITDFGLAKLLDVEGSQTQTDMIIGTPSYMAPEQAEGRPADMGRAADIYALGAILYAALTGHPPFRGKNRAQTLELVRTAEPVSLSRRRPGIPSGLAAVCLKCLEKRPSRRYPSAGALVDDLDRCLRDEYPRDVPGWAARLRRGWRRYTVAAAAVLLLVAGLWAIPHLHPEGPWWRLEKRLAGGGPVSLIGATGEPGYHRLRTGEESTKLGPAPDGSWAVHTWSACLVELARTPGHDRFHLSAWVHHEKSNRRGSVGIYAGHRASPGPVNEYHVLALMDYNDLESPADTAKSIPEGITRPLARENNVALIPHIYGETATGKAWNRRSDAVRTVRFQPARPGNQTYRHLELVVTPEQIRGYWDGQWAGDLSAQQFGQALADGLNSLRQQRPDDPHVSGIHPVFDPRGGLGLYVHHGTAWFKDVTLTPLGEAE